MAIKSGISHTLAAILGTIVSAIFVEYVKIWTPGILKILNKLGLLASQWLYNLIGITVPKEIFVPLFVASFLAFLWGILYHMARFGR